MKQFYIYETTNLINGKKYIGKHIGEIDDNYLGSGLLLKRAINKYGKENFTKKILYIATDLKELNEKEKEYIDKANAVKSDEYYNIHEGGDGGNTIAGWSEERKQAHHELLSSQRKGEKNPRYG